MPIRNFFFRSRRNEPPPVTPPSPPPPLPPPREVLVPTAAQREMFSNYLNRSPEEEEARHLKILDFYNRKTVAHRNPSTTTRSDLSDSGSTEVQGRQRCRPRLVPMSSDPPAPVVPFPAQRENQEIRTTWSSRHPPIQPEASRSVSFSHGPRSDFLLLPFDADPVGAFVILQPFISPQIPGSEAAAVDFSPGGIGAIQPQNGTNPWIDRSINAPPSLPIDPRFSSSLQEVMDDDDDDDEDDEKVPDALSGDATCSICSNVFRDPRILVCGHTFCLRCLVRMRAGARHQPGLTCPVCREVTFLASNDLRLLTKNFAVRNLVETIKITSKKDVEKLFASQSVRGTCGDGDDDDDDGGGNGDGVKTQGSSKVKITKELKETRSFPLEAGNKRVACLALMRQKIHLLFERSSCMRVISTKRPMFTGSSGAAEEETIALESIVNPLSLTSRESKNALFVLDALDSAAATGKQGVFTSCVWKVHLPIGRKRGSTVKTKKWLENLRTGGDMRSVSDGLMVALLVHHHHHSGGGGGADDISLDFYLTEEEGDGGGGGGGGGGTLARRISLRALGRPVRFGGMLGESRMVMAHLPPEANGERAHSGPNLISISIVSVEGKVLKSVEFGEENDLLAVASDGDGNVFLARRSKRKQVVKVDASLAGWTNLKLAEEIDVLIDAIGEKKNKLMVGHERKLSIYEG